MTPIAEGELPERFNFLLDLIRAAERGAGGQKLLTMLAKKYEGDAHAPAIRPMLEDLAAWCHERYPDKTHPRLTQTPVQIGMVAQVLTMAAHAGGEEELRNRRNTKEMIRRGIEVALDWPPTWKVKVHKLHGQLSVRVSPQAALSLQAIPRHRMPQPLEVNGVQGIEVREVPVDLGNVRGSLFIESQPLNQGTKFARTLLIYSWALDVPGGSLWAVLTAWPALKDHNPALPAIAPEVERVLATARVHEAAAPRNNAI